MTLNLAETSVVKNRSSVPYGANLFLLCIRHRTSVGKSITFLACPIVTFVYLVIHPFVRSQIATKLSHELIEQSRWN